MGGILVEGDFEHAFAGMGADPSSSCKAFDPQSSSFTANNANKRAPSSSKSASFWSLELSGEDQNDALLTSQSQAKKL